MSARDLLHRAEATGVQILADNGELVLRGNPSDVDALITEAKARKAELLDELTKPGIVTANEPLPDPQAEARRQRVLELLAANPSPRYALVTDTEADPVILALAIRGQATCELRIPRDKYDGFLLLALIERHGGAVH